MSSLDTGGHELKDFVEYARPRPPAFLLLSALLEIVYWPLLALAAVVLIFALPVALLLPLLLVVLIINPVDSFEFQTAWWGVKSLPFGITLYAAVASLGRLRQRLRVNARKTLEREGRRPILYLRSFYYENVDKNYGGGPEKNLFFEQENDDEVLSLALKQVGPLLAVGRGGGAVPPLGAVRLHFKDDEWREQVRRLIGLSRLVIIQPGYTEGMEWELKAVKELVDEGAFPPEKVIYSFLAWRHRGRAFREGEYDLFSKQMKRIHNCSLPEKLGGAYFLRLTRIQRDGEERWTPQLIGLKGWKALFFKFCGLPNLVWRLVKSDLLLAMMPALLKRLPTPRAFRSYSVPGVREALRPLAAAEGVGLPVWRTALFVTAVVVYVCSPFIIIAARLSN